MTFTAADMLEQGADLIENVGWVQGTARETDDNGEPVAFCLQGACTEVLYKHFGLVFGKQVDGTLALHMSAIYRTAHAAVWEVVGVSPARWNDWPGRTRAEVIEKMRLTAKDLRNSATPEGES